MLTLSRRIGESIMLNDDIEVIVKDIRYNNVRISIKAPDDVTILRNEVYERELEEMDELYD